MRGHVPLFLFAGAIAAIHAQSAPELDWRRDLMAASAMPPAAAGPQDVDRMEQNLRAGAPYFAVAAATDYEANRELLRRTAAYLAAVDLLARDPRLRASLGRAYLALAAWQYPMLLTEAAAAPRPEARPKAAVAIPEPPFPRTAPEVEGVAAADRSTASDLSARYDTAAAQAATAWSMTKNLERTLQAQGMALNTETAASLARVQLYLELAADALRHREWQDARIEIERAGYQAAKVLKTFGR